MAAVISEETGLSVKTIPLISRRVFSWIIKEEDEEEEKEQEKEKKEEEEKKMVIAKGGGQRTFCKDIRTQVYRNNKYNREPFCL